MPAFWKNTNNGAVLESSTSLDKYARRQKHMVPCDDKGNPTGGIDESSGEVAILQDRIQELEQQIVEMETELTLYRNTEVEVPIDETVKLEDVEPNKMELLLEAISELEAGNPDHFRTDGMPRVKYVEDVKGIDTTTDEVAAAWKQFNR